MQYILGKDQGPCVFCTAFQAESSADREYLILHRGARCGVIMNLFPYNNGHLLVVPYAHQASLENLPSQTLTEIMTTMNKCVSVLRATMGAEGFNIGLNLGKIAGAGIDEHVHMHVVPRWAGDTNFFTTLGGTRCIPESLEASYDKLREAWDETA